MMWSYLSSDETSLLRDGQHFKKQEIIHCVDIPAEAELFLDGNMEKCTQASQQDTMKIITNLKMSLMLLFLSEILHKIMHWNKLNPKTIYSNKMAICYKECVLNEMMQRENKQNITYWAHSWWEPTQTQVSHLQVWVKTMSYWSCIKKYFSLRYLPHQVSCMETLNKLQSYKSHIQKHPHWFSKYFDHLHMSNILQIAMEVKYKPLTM
jgi:hypothetical protein